MKIWKSWFRRQRTTTAVNFKPQVESLDQRILPSATGLIAHYAESHVFNNPLYQGNTVEFHNPLHVADNYEML